MNNQRLLELIDLLVAGDISAGDHNLLQKALKEDKAARSAFRERMDLEAGLRTWASEEGQFSSSVAAATNGSQHEASTFFSWQSTLLACSIAAGILLFVGIQLGAFLGNDRTEEFAKEPVPDSTQDRPTTEFVGVIRQQDDCEWSTGPLSQSGKLNVGKLSLAKGVAELSFDSGTEITLDAPCEIEVTSPDTARLLAGSVYVDVTELSNGFTLSTPESQIVDEGTEYAVSVEIESTEVHVFDGKVVWIPTIGGMGSQSDFEERIEAGEAKSYLRSEPAKSRFIPFGKRQFVRHIEQQIRESAGGSLIAYDGFENLAGRLRRGRSGFGWASGWQAGGPRRGPLGDIVDTPNDAVFGLDRSDRRQLSLANGCDIRRPFETPMVLTSGDTVFLSVLLCRQRSQHANESESLQISLEPDLPGRGRRLHQIVSFGTTTDGFPFIKSGNNIRKTASRIASDQTYLYVLKLAISKEGTFPSLRVYQPHEKVDATAPSSWTVSGHVGTAKYPPASIRIITGKNVAWQVDELKVGSTWKGVTAATITD